jgi:hypothetical protein
LTSLTGAYCPDTIASACFRLCLEVFLKIWKNLPSLLAHAASPSPPSPFRNRCPAFAKICLTCTLSGAAANLAGSGGAATTVLGTFPALFRGFSKNLENFSRSAGGRGKIFLMGEAIERKVRNFDERDLTGNLTVERIKWRKMPNRDDTRKTEAYL